MSGRANENNWKWLGKSLMRKNKSECDGELNKNPRESPIRKVLYLEKME